MLTDSCGSLPISRTSIRFQITVPASCSNRAGTWRSIFEVKTSLCIGPSPKQNSAQNAQTSGFWFCQVRQFNCIAHRKLRAQVDDVDSVKRTNCRCETSIGGAGFERGAKSASPGNIMFETERKGCPSVLPAGVQSSISARRLRLSQAQGPEWRFSRFFSEPLPHLSTLTSVQGAGEFISLRTRKRNQRQFIRRLRITRRRVVSDLSRGLPANAARPFAPRACRDSRPLQSPAAASHTGTLRH